MKHNLEDVPSIFKLIGVKANKRGNKRNYETTLNKPLSPYDYNSTRSHKSFPPLRMLFLQMLLILFHRCEPSNTPTHLANHLVLFSFQ